MIECVDFLSRSKTRLELLEALYKQGCVRKHELKTVSEASRTTIQRNIDGLENRDWIRSNNREYWITESGKHVTERFIDLLDTLCISQQFKPFMRWLPSDGHDLDLRLLENASLIVTNSQDPYAPVNRHIEFMKSTDRFRCMLPVVGLPAMQVARECVLEKDQSQEVIVDTEVANTLQTRENYQRVLGDLLSTERFQCHVVDRTIPFYVGMARGHVQIGVGDEEGHPRGLVESSEEDLREWAERTFEEYWSNAKPIGYPRSQRVPLSDNR